MTPTTRVFRGGVEPLRLGLLSTAAIHERAVFAAARDVDGVAVGAVASRSIERARNFASRRRVPVAYGRYEDLLADDAIEAVYVAVPNAHHERWTRSALLAGKHVLCEKPFTADAARAVELESLASRHGLVLWEAFHYAFHPEVAELVGWVHRGSIGAVRSVRAHFGWRLERDEDPRWRAELGGGALMDVGCYALHAARWLLRDERPVLTATAADWSPSGVDRTARLRLRSGDGAAASVACSLVEDTLRCELEVHGERGTLAVRFPFLPAVPTERGVRRLLRWRTDGGPWRPRADAPLRLSYSHQLEAFRDAVRAGAGGVASGPCSLAGGAALLERAAAALRAGASGGGAS